MKSSEDNKLYPPVVLEWADYENSDPIADLEAAFGEEEKQLSGSFLLPVVRDARTRLLGEKHVEAKEVM